MVRGTPSLTPTVLLRRRWLVERQWASFPRSKSSSPTILGRPCPGLVSLLPTLLSLAARELPLGAARGSSLRGWRRRGAGWGGGGGEAAAAILPPAHVHRRQRSASSRQGPRLPRGWVLHLGGWWGDPEPEPHRRDLYLHNPIPPHHHLSSRPRLEMRVGLPSEASSCLWSARGPRDRPERRRSGLAHVVRKSAAISSFFAPHHPSKQSFAGFPPPQRVGPPQRFHDR